ncbi:Bug family tripartite tricarboxylate transporter substrate binding protein [Candidatus Formimonas warabiya]|uniref:Tripartite tricarboxylate transporter substrate binding protein n=1 Tax=Formimonas warabiya TaxID=1761012 RepID=A0A3G1KMS6_FORW1|nr:tripartite tricarboxylate transporter substrate binding protein [Candidatus Formimonas warabiya]ATW23720.1 hypothetical protein DCMF_01950 [Candidatus Formimonas warabiya]
MNKKIKIPFMLLLLLGLVLIFSGCGTNSEGNQPSSSEASQPTNPEYPTENISWYVGSQPGGGFDTYARGVSRAMQKYIPNGDKIQILVENMPGAAHRRALEFVYNSEPDGTKLLNPNIPGNVIVQMTEKVNYDLAKVKWIGAFAVDKYVMCVSKNSKFKTIEDLQNADASKPVRFGSQGYGSTDYLLLIAAGQDMKIPNTIVTGFEGSSEVIMAMLRNEIDLLIYPITSILDYIKSGDLIPLMVLDSEKNELLPDVSTSAELGYPDLTTVAGLYRMIGVAPDTPQYMVDTLREALEKTMQDEELIQWSKDTDHPLTYISGEECAESIEKLQTAWAKYIDAIQKSTGGATMQ